MVCSLCGAQQTQKKSQHNKVSVCKECRAYFAKKREYNELLLKIFNDDPTLRRIVA